MHQVSRRQRPGATGVDSQDDDVGGLLRIGCDEQSPAGAQHHPA
jgi:hypothetical protein